MKVIFSIFIHTLHIVLHAQPIAQKVFEKLKEENYNLCEIHERVICSEISMRERQFFVDKQNDKQSRGLIGRKKESERRRREEKDGVAQGVKR